MRKRPASSTLDVEGPVLSAHQTIEHAAATTPSRRAALCVAGLAVATALVLMSIAGTLEHTPPASGELGGIRAAAAQFYDAANQALLTGDGASLSLQVTSNARFVDPVTGDWVSFDAFASRLSEIGRANRGARLEIMSLTVHRQEAVAQVRIAGNASSLNSVSNIDRDGSWVDQLTVRGGVVTVLTGGTASLRPSNQWFDGIVPRIGIVSSVGLVTVTLASGATLPLDAPGTLLGLVREGIILLELDEESPAVELVMNDVPVATPVHGQSVALHRGDRFTMPSGTGVRIRNQSLTASILQLVGLWSPSGLEPGTAVKQHKGRFSGFLVDGPPGAIWEGATGGRATMDIKLEFETGRASKQLSIEEISLSTGAGLTQQLHGSYEHQVALMVLEGAVVIDPTSEFTGSDMRPSLLDGPAGTIVSQHATRVQQVGALPAVLLILQLDHKGAFQTP
jgi:hypothetical protein